ncbi:hypothetical protein SYYSPA8_14825 [Streptomyces yaizuensis]|uniref:Uncharacterized protein n=1 Tax=Streptomyces yaizuensis TaxID=2989713 RepID=A0ABQ5NYZ8_9ACTN|nr:hypothetical protein SYYSPA8_14825 [Streptomyces sp. YSPA8]
MFGIAEIVLGRVRTLVVAYVRTLAGTLYARFGVAVGPDGLLGLPASDAWIVDTGPSAAVAGLALDGLGFLLQIVALRSIPLYAVGAALAASLAVTAVAAGRSLGARPARAEWSAVGAVRAGPALVALAWLGDRSREGLRGAAFAGYAAAVGGALAPAGFGAAPTDGAEHPRTLRTGG